MLVYLIEIVSPEIICEEVSDPHRYDLFEVIFMRYLDRHLSEIS